MCGATADESGYPSPSASTQKVKRLRDLKNDLPGAANNRRKYLSAMFGWAIETTPQLMKANPAREVRRIKYATRVVQAGELGLSLPADLSGRVLVVARTTPAKPRSIVSIAA
jgi:hypothetical protein